MAISATEYLDNVVKKLLFGLSKTATSLVKFGSNESIPSPIIVYPENIWTDAATIPLTPPVADTAIVKLYTGANRIHMTADPTSPVNETWLATETFGTPSSRLTDFIPFSISSGYAPRVYIGDPNGGPAARIYPDTSGEEWFFDPASGVLNFPTAVPGTKTATVGSGSVSVGANGIYIEVYRYIGQKGGGSGGVSPDDLGSMAYQDSDAVDITGGTIEGVTFINVTIDGGTF